MSKVSITRTLLDDLAMSISAKSGEAVPMTLTEMKDAVDSISGGGTTIDALSVTANGTYTAQSGHAYSPVTVSVPTPTPSLQTKTASYIPSASQQTETISADSGYDGLDSVSITVDPISLTQYALRPDAELLQTYTMDQYAVADLGLTIPSYVTSAQTLKASASLSPTITVDLNNYRYIAVERFLTIPEYSVTTKGKGRQEYLWCNYVYEVTRSNANVFPTIIDATKKIASAQTLWATSYLYRHLYWTSSSAITLYGSNAYGCYQTPYAPSISDSTMTVKSPLLGARGHSTYFTSTYMNALTDIRYQYVIDVYRAPLNNLNVDGWEQEQMLQHMVGCINSTDHKLT